MGSDIKIMGFRYKDDFEITLCIPQIGKYVHSLDEYKRNILFAKKYIENIFNKNKIKKNKIYINTRDNYEKGELYLTAIGSSIESGDEGLVGRGNRVQGLISPTRLMSMEGVAGKNPVYHIGKVYYVVAQKISDEIYKEFSITNEVALISQSGRDLFDPWVVFIHVQKSSIGDVKIKNIVKKIIKEIPNTTNDIINGEIMIC